MDKARNNIKSDAGGRSFEETRQIADESLYDMHTQLARMTRTYNNYLLHGAVNAAEELACKMDDLERDILFEEDMYKLAFQ